MSAVARPTSIDSPFIEEPKERGPSRLHWKNRPKAITEKIDRVFSSLTHDTKSSWGLYNGDMSYQIGGLDDTKMIARTIEHAPATQKEFVFLDIGAGNFQWIDHMVKVVNTLSLDPKIQVHFIGVRGERYLGESFFEIGICKIHKLGGVKIEELSRQFETLGLPDKIDIIVSRWTFRHLVDPVGTFQQAYNLLRPGGLIALDGFCFNYTPRWLGDECWDRRVVQLLLDMRVSFLFRHFDYKNSASHFIIERTKHKCSIPMKYAKLVDINARWDVGSRVCTVFTRNTPSPLRDVYLSLNPYFYLGSLDLFRRVESLFPEKDDEGRLIIRKTAPFRLRDLLNPTDQPYPTEMCAKKMLLPETTHPTHDAKKLKISQKPSPPLKSISEK